MLKGHPSRCLSYSQSGRTVSPTAEGEINTGQKETRSTNQKGKERHSVELNPESISAFHTAME